MPWRRCEPDRIIGSATDPNAVFLPNAEDPTWTPYAGPPAVTCASEGARALIGRSAKASVAFQDLETDDFLEARPAAGSR